MTSAPLRRRRALLSLALFLVTLVGLAGVATAAPPSGTPGQQKKVKTTTTTVAPTTTTTVAPTTTTTTVPGVPARTIGGWRGAYAPHGWVAVPRPDEEVRRSVTAMAEAGFGTQLLNLGTLDGTGTVPASAYPALADWLRVTGSTGTGMRTVLWINGSEAAHVDDVALHPAIASGIARLLATYPVDGVMLDLEPFRRDNPAYLSLVRTIRAAVPGAWIGASAPADGQWSSTFIRDVSVDLDAIAPMLYDTSATAASTYTALVASEHDRFVRAAGTAATILPTLPAYGANRWHDPAVESVENAVAGIAASATGSAAGAAVYSWYEMDAASKQQWLTAISG